MAGAPATITAVVVLVPMVTGAVSAVARELRANRRQRHSQARQNAADRQRRHLESQTLKVVRQITDPERQAEIVRHLLDAYRGTTDAESLDTEDGLDTGFNEPDRLL
ncbi:hypothetical protein [Catenulispora rubra]|uniref:hypothetical protein n=1 Tax=Catenulispora rubra TaxID=280293 RepID=UPI0018924552|nr:hypothetical protein [Catenulispora rubra]